MFRPSLAALALTVVVLGCGQPGETVVTGTVKYQGKPLGNGVVLLVFDDGNEAAGAIKVDGSGGYTVRTPFTGHARVAVSSPKPSPPPADSGRNAPPPPPDSVADPAKWFPIPEHFSDPGTSGKETTVKPGSNTFDIEL